MRQLVCPISTDKVDEKTTRINALIGILLVITGFVMNSSIFLIVLMADFFMRAFTQVKYSPVSYVSYRLSNALNLKEKQIAKAPKIFAARLGFFMSLVIVGLFLAQLHTAAMVVAGMLIFFATLEFALGICMGCIIYTYVVLPFYK
ncbi:DUF4395 domain-containing protein [Draconibacterium sp. IB214405]|uniref:DUF4395 domain-containing protein n=1 Tax=Draconibacterium sp. IB214405 TaxID=3097352 RepID=UPI002A17A71D|nr:DUF4395 domain-containing protein [Draconibacterium sp. IB214405]MDX8337653.1 DUF4395 domain-containing protein [Draconibacterium sp. IB214405]